ncbi:MAG TPA: MGMT family protein [Syntrophales bacterium]|nr:MGMT family protein [Syntrophales bacterium]
MKSIYYSLAATTLGDVGVVWRQKGDTPVVVRIFLPTKGKMESLIRQSFPDAVRRSYSLIDQICVSIRESLSGKAVSFPGTFIDKSIFREFQRKIFSQAMKIPKGRVSTYGGLAKKAGIPKGARAVGRVLAGNPYPLVIPCHRIVQADGGLCGFGGGLKLKRDLLSMEGVTFDSKGRVLPEFFL